MRPLSPAVCRRFLLLGALIATLVLAGCGDSGDPAIPGKEDSGGAGTTTSTDGAAPGTNETTEAGSGSSGATGPDGKGPEGGGGKAAASGPCGPRLGEFVQLLSRLRVRLATGLSYEEYAAAVKRARSAYAFATAKLPAECLVAAGTAAEQSLNRYIEAANAWGECLADAGCDAGVVEPELQRDWQIASHWLSEAQEGLKRLS
jgi:hypothetical protein